MFIYQCQNLGKKIYLITRHEKDLGQTLAEYHIDKGLFEGVIHLTFDDVKADHIKPEKAIFVDNAFQERNLAQEAFPSMPVFDVDAIEVLLDWRT
jgi:hypothetical protein